MTLFLVLLIGTGLSFANGGNDQFKGVATLYGSGVASYRGALFWATLTAALGAIGAFYFGSGLIAAFSGKGLVPQSVVGLQSFSLAVGLAAASTVFLATLIKLPISTTHALIGGLIGAGLIASPEGVNLNQLAGTFVVPLLLSPVLSGAIVFGLYPLLHRARLKAGVTRETCVCVGGEMVATSAASVSEARTMISQGLIPSVTVASEAVCQDRYQGRVLGISGGALVDSLHYLSAGAVCLARAMNDVPKLAAVFLIGQVLSPMTAIAGVTAAMLTGGLIQSRKIAETMGTKMTEMNPGQALTANLVTGVIVLFSSKLGVPVSTTHVACGSLFGIGASTGTLRTDMMKKILLAWLFTLPVGGILGCLYFLVLRGHL